MFCPHCGYQTAPELRCSSCGVVLLAPAAPSLQTRVVRPRHPRMIAGVCSGIAIRYGWDVAVLRVVLTVAACLTTGAVVLFYLAAWVLLPEAQYALPSGTRPYGNRTTAF